MRVSVFGLGYVGTVSAGCLAHDGHEVVGIDSLPTKVDLINRGQSPIVEVDIGELVAATARAGRLRATSDPVQAIRETELSFVCVGTPSQANGNLDLRYIRRICEQIGQALKTKTVRHTVVIRSTILPGTMRSVVIPTLEEFSGKKAGVDFCVCNNPEFLREGSAVKDFRSPPKTVIGELDKASGDMLAKLYEKLEAPLIRTDLESAEMVKYVDNSWHALKIGFANEIGNLCKSFGIDAHAVMNIFCQDRKLNISSAYLLPGFAFGGSCLPKDLRALSYQAKMHDLDLPILTSILASNEMQITRGLRLIMEKGHTRVGVLGFSFKAGTDDLRESPMIEIIERLIGKGYDLRIYDKNVNIASLIGANRDFILNHIPHISKLMVGDIDAVLNHAQTVVIGTKDPDFKSVPERLREGQLLVDFVRIIEGRSEHGKYDGICW
ncbi:MAG TPA: UDP-glucose/GDP-mannose dehydrogenase family protein [Gemmataceae bacterium]|nr:UDP-glucose/GDP-mannose dehydrogenase family protein [Terriglobales bacterium]HLN33106.1 UDP-glucose/GDP-mannose dehydrogenase family protein [Gemmataceae bacterium]